MRLKFLSIGINTVLVVGRIGNNLRMDYTAQGDTTNLAAAPGADGAGHHPRQ
jgi:hypothetical protein